MELWGMGSTSLLLLLLGPLWPRLIVTVRVPSMSQIKLFNQLVSIFIRSYLKPYSSVQIIYIT